MRACIMTLSALTGLTAYRAGLGCKFHYRKLSTLPLLLVVPVVPKVCSGTRLVIKRSLSDDRAFYMVSLRITKPDMRFLQSYAFLPD